jgi:glucokinase
MRETISQDERIVITLDAGGTNLLFSAIKGGKEIIQPVHKPCMPNDLGLLLALMEEGFREVIQKIGIDIHAVSFAFPGPADYPRGIIGDLPNLPAFRGGVALGPFLEERLNLPVYINNDANLYALGEYIFGFLPEINAVIKQNGGNKVFRNLVGLTLGSGFGCGIVIDGCLLIGDNSNGGELWLMRNKLFPELCTDASIGNEKIRRLYARFASQNPKEVPDSKGIYEIATGKSPGNQDAAILAFESMGEVIGDAIANVSILVDGLVVIGGGLSAAHELFMPAVMRELNGNIMHLDQQKYPRIGVKAYYLEDEKSIREFSKGNLKSLIVPFSDSRIDYDQSLRIGIGISSLGTSKAIALGAYAFAITRS